jgi:hypothetical protein
MGRECAECAQCGSRIRDLTPSVHGPLCLQCAYRQYEHDQPGHGLAPGTWGFPYEDE